MKKLLSIIAVVFFTSAAFSQEKTSESKSPVTAAPKYCCPKCDFCSVVSGNCTHHHLALVKEGMYYCPMHGDVTSDKPGKCPKCGMELSKMELETETKYCCPKCEVKTSPVKGQCPHSTDAIIKDGELYCVPTYDKSGKCPHCGTQIEKIEIKKKKDAEHYHRD